MIWMTLAFAGHPAVERVVWARPFTLVEAHADAHVRPLNGRVGEGFHEGWLVELRVDPRAMEPRAIGVPLLWVGDALAARVNWDGVGGCAVVWVAGAHDLRAEPVFFGSTELPERVGPEVHASDREAARIRGELRPLAADRLGDVDGPALAVADFAALMEVAAGRIAACSPSEADRARSLSGGAASR